MAAVTFTPPSPEVFDPWLSSHHWSGSSLTYSFPTDGSFYDYQSTTDVTPLSATQQDAVRRVLADIASFTALSFVEITETVGSEATLRLAREVGLSGGYAYLPTSLSAGGDAFFGTGTTSPQIGNEGYVFFTHEIGHAMGLEHGHEFPAFVASGLDSQEFTVVTYTDYVGDTDTFSYDTGPVDWAQSFMQLDIAALQFLYGANYAVSGEVWSGNTIYSFSALSGEMSINGVAQGIPAGNRIFRTIWDGDGTDTYDLSSYTSDLKIDLAPGAWSVFSTVQLADLNFASSDPQFLARGNLANARLVDGDARALIENAIGGRGDDLLSGNAAANRLTGNGGRDDLRGLEGNDVLLGGAGKDMLDGGDGDDRLRAGGNKDVLKGEDGADNLDGGAGDDRLQGGADADVLFGGAGADKLYGGADNDRLFGGDDADILIGGGGFDRLFGEGGADTFRFESASESGGARIADRIMDFANGEDVIDLSALAPALIFLASGSLMAGETRVVTEESGGDTTVWADVDGDGSADFELLVVATLGLDAGDFLL